MKIFTVVGARPQFIKAAVISRAIVEKTEINEVLVHTGQHFDSNMSEIFFREMDIPKPKYQLNINSMSHGKMTGRMLEGLEELMLKERPSVVLVYGDTNSTLAGALAASKLHIPIAHVEAGLRSFNMRMPEEINRILTDRISRWLFCPTEHAVKNLQKEGYSEFGYNVIQSGDIMYDALLFYKENLEQRPSTIQISKKEFILATLHREENIKDLDRFKELISGLNYVHKNLIPVIMPLHPGTAQRLREVGLDINIEIIDPVGYFDMIRLIQNCNLVLTDSGGLQKEAFLLNKYCVTMRSQTEWIELIDHKVNFLVGANKENLIKTVKTLLLKKFPTGLSLYGTGNAGNQIIKTLISTL